MQRFRDIAFDMSNVAIFDYPSCVLPPTEGLPWDDLRRMARLQNGVEFGGNIAENFNRLSKVQER